MLYAISRARANAARPSLPRLPVLQSLPPATATSSSLLALQEQSPLTTALVTVPLIPGAVPVDGKGWSLLVQRLARLQAQRSAALTCGDLPTYLRLNGRIHRIQRRLLSQIRDSPLAPRRRQRVGKLKRLMLRLQQWFKPNALHPRSPQNRLSYPSSGRGF